MVCVLIEDKTSAANKNKYFISIKHKTVQEQPISIQENTLAYFPISLNLCEVIIEYNMTEKLGTPIPRAQVCCPKLYIRPVTEKPP